MPTLPVSRSVSAAQALRESEARLPQPGEEARPGVLISYPPRVASASMRAKRARRSRLIGRKICPRATEICARAARMGVAPGCSSGRALAAAEAGGRFRDLDIGSPEEIRFKAQRTATLKRALFRHGGSESGRGMSRSKVRRSLEAPGADERPRRELGLRRGRRALGAPRARRRPGPPAEAFAPGGGRSPR
ncbi:hypothetical protein MCBRY_003073 [Methylocystis bryophila]